jgi:HEAT repeat protein
MSTRLGSARTLLLAALALAAVVMVVSVAVLSTSDSSDSSSGGAGRGEGGGLGIRDSKRRPNPAKGESDESDDSDEDEDPEGEEWRSPGRSGGGPDGTTRLPRDGDDEYKIDETSLRAVFAARHWEEIRRQMDVLQEEGKTVPPDLVKELMAMLAKEDTRLDAVLALGGVKDDATGRALAELATSEQASLQERQAALQALAKSGQDSALSAVTRLATDAATSEELLRYALPALAGIGGPQATQTLLDLKKKHAGDPLEDVILNALMKSHGSAAPLSQAMTKALAEGDKETIRTAVLVAQMQGEKAGPEMKAQLESIVSGGASLSGIESEDERLVVQGMAMPAAVAMGAVEPVLRAATSSGPLRDVALHALRQARGDDAAKQIAAALARATDETQRRELTVALGETLSKTATPTLVALLDDPAVNVRNAAARGLGQVRDPAAVKPLLAHLAKATGDRDFANGIVYSLGVIGVNDALPALDKLAASDDEFWRELRPFVQNAATRIRTGNPDSQLLDTARNSSPK